MFRSVSLSGQTKIKIFKQGFQCINISCTVFEKVISQLKPELCCKSLFTYCSGCTLPPAQCQLVPTPAPHDPLKDERVWLMDGRADKSNTLCRHEHYVNLLKHSLKTFPFYADKINKFEVPNDAPVGIESGHISQQFTAESGASQNKET